MFTLIRVLVLAWKLRTGLKEAGIPLPLVKEVPAIVQVIKTRAR